MRLVRWTSEASDQFEAAVKYIRQDKPTTARNVAQTVIDRIEQLATFPGLGRPGEVRGTRELVSPPDRVVIMRVKNKHVSDLAGLLYKRGRKPLPVELLSR